LSETSDVSKENQTAKKKAKKYPRNRVKKVDQYRNQIIEDQYGVFEYDKDPDGYLKARKRMLNKKSALRTRSRKTSKFKLLNEKVQVLEDKSKVLETENKDLKNENSDLQRKVQELLSVINNMKGADAADEVRKRFKISELEEQSIDHINSSTNNPHNSSHDISGSFLMEGEQSEFLSSGEEEFGGLQKDNWLCQADIMGHISESSPIKRVITSTNDAEGSFSSSNNQLNLSSEESDRLVLQRGEDKLSEEGLFGGTFGNYISQASLLTLTIVMCLVLCLTRVGDTTEERDFHASAPGGRVPMSAEFLGLKERTISYLKIAMGTVFILGIVLIKCGGCLEKLGHDPRRKRKEHIKAESQ